MKKKSHSIRNLIYTACFLLLTFLILTHSQESLYYALHGLNLWFTKMIPALFPFMILSGIMIRLSLTENFVTLLYPVLHPILRVRKNVCYAIIMGFLCGFPMGARVTADLLKRDMITEREAEFLLAFCNNIGPVYFLSFVLPLLHRTLIWPYVFGMYGLPFLYGIFLRYTAFRELDGGRNRNSGILPSPAARTHYRKELLVCSDTRKPLSLLNEIDEAIVSATHSILMLGGYMILFNLFNLIPAVVFPIGELPALLAPVLEITGGLGMMGDTHPLCALLLLPFGGLSCIAQTYSMIRDTPLSIHTYVWHKLFLTLAVICYYTGWYFLSPGSFLR